MSHKKILAKASRELTEDAKKYHEKAAHAKSKVKKKHEHIEEKEAHSAARSLKSKAKKMHEY